MKKDFNRIDEMFRDSLNDYQEVPSSHVWKALSKKLLLLDFARFNLINFPKYLLLYSFTAIVSAGTLSYFLISQHGLEHLSEQEALIVAGHTPEIDDLTITSHPEPVALNTHSNDHQQINTKNSSIQKKMQNSDNVKSGTTTKTKRTSIASEKRQTPSSDEMNPAFSQEGNVVLAEDKEKGNAKTSSGKETKHPEKTTSDSQSKEARKSKFEDPSLTASTKNSLETAFVEKHISSDTENNKVITDDSDAMVSAIEENLVTTLLKDVTFTGDSVEIVLAVPADFDPSVERIPPTRKTALSVELFGAPTFMSKNLTPEDALLENYVAKRNKEEKSLISFLLGAEVKYEINRFNFVSGINYSEFKERTEYNIEIKTGTRPVTIRDTLVDPNSGKTYIRETSLQVPVYEPATQVGKNRLKYIDIPVLFGYKFGGDSKFTIDVLTGASYSFLANTKGYIMAPYEFTTSQKRAPFNTLDLANKEESPFNKSNINLLLRVGCAYKVNDKWSIVLRPSLKYNLTSVLKKELPYGQKFYIFGLNTGVNYEF